MMQGIRAAVLILLVALMAGAAYTQTSAADIYKVKCAMCHGAKGLADTSAGKAMKVISFKDPAKLKASDARLIASTQNGVGTMKGYKGTLTDQQIKDVIAYIRTLQK